MAIRIKYAFLTTESDEPQAVANFIAGYELAGGDWNGTIDIDENISQSDFTQAYVDEQINNGYDMLLRNTAVNSTQVNNVFSNSIKRGMLPVVPVASNYYHDVGTTTSAGLYSAVFCGSGLREQGNATAYPCMFFDVAPSEDPTEIREVRQCGTEYTISQIYRYSPTLLFIKLSGVSDVRTIGITEHGIPLYISTTLTGTNISPLPTGVVYVTGVETDGSAFWITHSTSAGTGLYQNVTTGKMKYGITNENGVAEGTNKVLIIGIGGLKNLAISLNGITGFQNNPNGNFGVSEFVNNDSYGDKCKIVHSLGTGTYGGDGVGTFATESYSTPFIAGQLAYIKDVTGFDWYDVIGNALVTSSNYPTPDEFSGYGYLQIDKAIDPYIDKTLTAPVLELEEQQTGAITFSWNMIPYAKKYEIYFRGELIVTLNAQIIRYTLSPGALGFYPNISSSKRNLIKVRAVRDSEYSDFSNEIEYLFYAHTGILYKNYA